MLTKEQIEYLFNFCQKHFVKYYDVQVELVDHLANAVELEMIKDHEITFENAVEKVHASFGIMGFAPLVAEKQKMAEKQSRKLFFKLFKEQFKWPKILLFFVLNAGFYSICSQISISIDLILISITAVSCIFFFLSLAQLQWVTKKTGKKFLIINFSWISSFIILPGYLANYFRFIIPNAFSFSVSSDVAAILDSLFLSIYLIIILAMIQTMLAIKIKLCKQYPELFSVSK
jgi:hypothetical protein